MLNRLTRAAIAFAVTVAAYQGYVLAVAPWVEPAGAAAATAQALSREELLALPGGVEKYRPLLGAYFPADHWALQRRPAPIIIENGQALVVLNEYSQSDSGELKVPRCAIVFFPTPRDGENPAPRNVVILEPAGGATLQMDQRMGAGLGGMGRMQYGQLLGAVRVRSDMREAGPADDLAIETRDLYMNADFIRTAEPVEFHMGAHHGRGRGLEIRFFRTAGGVGAPTTGPFGKLDSLVVSSEVAAQIMPGQTTLFGESTGSSQATPGPSRAAAPADIQCAGSFRVDFGARVATFSDRVLVRQRNPGGKLDELTAEMLTLYFAEVREWGGDVTPTPADGAPALTSVRLEPATVTATGTPENPVRLKAPSHEATAVGDRLSIEIIQRQVTLEGGDNVMLTYRGAEVHAPMVRYELPPKNSTARLGVMAARGGGGWLRAAPDPARPSEVLEVRWTDSMQLVRRSGQPVLVLDGRPRVAMLGMGTLWADQLELYLREAEAGAALQAPPAEAGRAAFPTTIEAERIVATGHVGIESAELVGQVDQLDLEISYPPAQAAAAGGGGAVPSAGPAATGPPALFDRNRGGARRAYNITGSILKLGAIVRDRRPQISSIHVDGGVVFEETTPGAAGPPPLRILAEHLLATGAETPNARIEIRGGDARGGQAEITARGTVLQAPMLLIHRGTSQAEINSPGRVKLLMTRDATGQPLAQPTPLDVTWQESMRLNQDRITFRGDVAVKHADGWLRTRRMEVVLTAPVRFDGGGGQAEPEVAQLECWEGAVAEFDQRDADGVVTAHQRIEVESLIVNRVTGKIAGDGPGRVDSVHYSSKAGSWLTLPDATGAAPPTATPVADPGAPPELRRLTIEFIRGVAGNLHQRTVQVEGDVEAIYGPVASWDQQLEMTPGGRPGPDEIWITCDTLGVTESPLARLQEAAKGHVELRAQGSVVIEVEHPERGAFTLSGEWAGYDQLKTMFTLKGSNRSLATITNQAYPGAPPSTQSAEEFTFWQNTGEAKIIGGRGEFSNFD